MRARVLMGYNRNLAAGNWKRDPDGERGTTPTLHDLDLQYFKFEISGINAKTILEFGPGASTEFFASLGLQVTTIEHIQKWYEVAKERFKNYPNVRVLKGEDEMPFVCPELGDEMFDLAFVDAPQGYAPRRKVHTGYEDCSRYNTTHFALQHAPVVLLHDVVRPLERGTLGRLHVLGYKVEIINLPYGMARITWPQDKTLSTAPSETSAPSPKAKRRTTTRTRRSASSSTECSGNSKLEMSSISPTSTSMDSKTNTSSPSDISSLGVAPQSLAQQVTKRLPN